MRNMGEQYRAKISTQVLPTVIFCFCFLNMSAQSTKMNNKNNFLNITEYLSVARFEKIKHFILAHGNRQTYRQYDNDNPYYKFENFDVYLGADIGQKNINNDPKVSDFNELMIRADMVYYSVIIVRKGDIAAEKFWIEKGMKENEVYFTNPLPESSFAYKEIPPQLIVYINEMLRVCACE
jgi:hypothetical protein